MKYSKADAEQARANLLEVLKPGDTVYTVLRHVSRSGMMRHISLFVMRDNEPRHITYWAAALMGFPQDMHNDGIKVGGCGMDMGFYLVYGLSLRLFHVDGKDGGYALKHQWL